MGRISSTITQNALLHTHITFLYTTREQEMKPGRTVQNTHMDQAMIEFCHQ